MNRHSNNFKIFVFILVVLGIFEALFLIHTLLAGNPSESIDGIGIISVWATVLTVVFLVFSIMGMMNIDSRIKELNEIRDRLMDVERKVVDAEKDFKASADQEKKNLVKKAQEQIVDIINKSAERQNIFDHLTQIANIPDPNAQIKRYTEILRTKTEKDGVNISFVHTRRGEAFQIMERDNEAKADFEQAIKIAPKEADPYIALGCFYVYRKKDYKHSIECFKKAAELNPQFPPIYVNIGNSYSKLGNFEEAEKYYKLAEDYSVESFEWYYNKANAIREAGDDPEGDIQERYLKYCLKLNPLFLPAALNLAMVYKCNGNLDKAEKVLTEKINTMGYKPEFIDAIIQRGECSILNNNYAGAFCDFSLAYVYRPTDILTLLRLGQLNLKNAQVQRAIDFASLGIKESQRQNDARFLEDLQKLKQTCCHIMTDIEHGRFQT